MKKRILTLLAVLAVLVGALSIVGMAAEPVVETLSADVTDYLVTTDMTLNLAGKNITNLTVEAGVKLVLQDSVGDGEITNITGGGIVELANGYMNFADGNRLTLKTAGISLQTKDLDAKGASLYYTSTFAGNAAVKGKISSYGVAMYIGSAKNLFAENTYTVDDAATWETNGEFHDNGVLLAGVLKTGNAYSVNKLNATRKINSVPYVAMADGTRITGATATRTMQQVVEAVVTEEIHPSLDVVFWDTLSYEKKDFVLDLYGTFSTFMSSWDMGRVAPLFNKAEDQTYYIYDKFDAEHMPAVTGADIQLMASIDMEGAAIDGLTNFTGSFYGNGNTLSNMTINGIGLVDSVTAGETVSNLHLRDVEVVVPADSNATAVGTIAGTNKGTITNVTIKGVLRDTRAGSEGNEIYAGVITGNNAGTVTVGTTNLMSISNARDEEGNLKMSITSSAGYVAVNENDLTVTGLSADAGLWMNETSDYVIRGGLIGTGTAATNADNVIWNDRSFSTERQAAELQRRRKLVEADVFEQATIKWTPATTIKYWHNQTDNPNMEKPSNFLELIAGGKWHIHNQTFTPGTTYYGIPYTHCASPLEQAKFYMTEGNNGVYTLKSEITNIKGGKDNKAGESTWSGNGGTDKIGWGRYFGSDCTGGPSTAWHKVSPILLSSKTNGGVCLYYSSDMMPSQFNQWYYGIRQVGDYEVDDAAWSTGTVGDPIVKETKKDAEGNVIETIYWTNEEGEPWRNYSMDTTDMFDNMGTTVFYEAYAQSQLGDMVIATDRDAGVGHGRMIAADPVVIRNGANTIDATKSYFLFHEQGAGLYTSPGISSWRVNWKCSFAEAALQAGNKMGGNGNGYYLPISMDAFHDASIIATGTMASGGNILTGNDPLQWKLNSSYRIMSAQMIIKDEQGNEVYNQIRFQGTASGAAGQYYRRGIPGYIPVYASVLFADCCDNLENGHTYYATFSGTTYGGLTKTMMENYKFEYTPTSAS